MKNIVRVLVVVLVLAMLVSLAACGSKDSKDEEKNDAPAATEAAKADGASALVGTWDSEDAEGTSYTFNEDGTGSINVGASSMDFTYIVKDSQIEFTYSVMDPQSENYTIDGDILTIGDDDYGYLTYKKNDGSAKATERGNAVNNNSALVGTWVYDEDTTQSVTYNSDGTGSVNLEGLVMAFTYVDDGTTIESTLDGCEPTVETYKIEGNKLITTNEDNETYTFTKQ